ncbi:hypothetical protein HK104_006740, partial [Borealophlyctis nickersoniae]
LQERGVNTVLVNVFDHLVSFFMDLAGVDWHHLETLDDLARFCAVLSHLGPLSLYTCSLPLYGENVLGFTSPLIDRCVSAEKWDTSPPGITTFPSGIPYLHFGEMRESINLSTGEVEYDVLGTFEDDRETYLQRRQVLVAATDNLIVYRAAGNKNGEALHVMNASLERATIVQPKEFPQVLGMDGRDNSHLIVLSLDASLLVVATHRVADGRDMDRPDIIRMYRLGEFGTVASRIDLRLENWKKRDGAVLTCLNASHNGQWVVTGRRDGRIQLWDSTTGKTISTFLYNDGTKPIGSVAVRSDGKLVMFTESGSGWSLGSSNIYIWDVEANALTGHIPGAAQNDPVPGPRVKDLHPEQGHTFKRKSPIPEHVSEKVPALADTEYDGTGWVGQLRFCDDERFLSCINHTTATVYISSVQTRQRKLAFQVCKSDGYAAQKATEITFAALNRERKSL